MIELVGVSVKQGERTLIAGCNLSIRAGEVLGVVGGRGSGKSTLLKVLAGQQAIERGQIRIDGRDVTRQMERLRSAAGYLSTRVPGPRDLTAEEWLSLWSELNGLAADRRQNTIKEECERFRAPLGQRPLTTYSSGELSALNLARVWLQSPRFFVLDNPTHGLDGEGLRVLSEAVGEVASQGTTVILSETSPHLPVSVCDRVVILSDGGVSADVSRADPQFESMVASAQGWSR